MEAVQGYVASRSELPLVVVGSAPYADDYTAAVQAAADDRVRLLGGVWDQELLDQLYAHASTYLHGHSVGGTNPSLLRAAGAGAYTLAFDVSFNREVIGERGRVLADAGDLAGLLDDVEADPDRAHRGGEALQEVIGRYNWDDVALAYEDLCRRLASGQSVADRPSGRRSGVPDRRPASRDLALQR